MTGFPFSAAGPARHAGPLPDACDVVVIGGGIIGVMTAWFLCKNGARVVLCEKGRIGAEQSGRNWGWIRKQGRPPSELPMMMEALDIWSRLEAEAGADLGFRQSGVLYLANTDKGMAGFDSWMVHARAHGLDSRIVSAAGVAAMLPHASAWAGGIWTPSDARAEPWVAVPALAAALEGFGASLHEDCAVRAIDVVAGSVAGVVTEKGRIRADLVVLAGGAWSSLLARAHGVDFPLLSVRASVSVTAPMPFAFDGAAADRFYAFRKRADGGLTLTPRTKHDLFVGPDAMRHLRRFLPLWRQASGYTRLRPAAPAGFPDAWGTPRRWDADRESPFERMRILDPAPDMKVLAAVQDRFAADFPSVGRPQFVAAWAGMIDMMPDVLPVIDRVAALPGLILATGLSGHGFGIGPGVGRVVADLALGRSPGHDLSRFRLSRFSDGSKIDIWPSL